MAVVLGLQGVNMPTASNMPMPLNAMDSFSKGFGMTDNLMKNLMAKQQLAQQMQIHKDSLGIQQQQQARLQELFPLQKRAQQLQLEAAERQYDPAKQMDYFNRLKEAYANMQGQPSSPMPTQPVGQGMGAFNADQVLSPQAQPQPIAQPQTQNPNAVIQTPFGNITPQDAQAMLASGMKLPGVEQQLKKLL